MKLWAVTCDAGGAHEASCVYSVWTTPEGAEAERSRLVATQGTGGCYAGDFDVVEITADVSEDEWIG